MADKVSYWIELSDYDLETAEAMQDSGRFLYVAFMSHQAIEKILKAYYVKFNNSNPPYTHSLSYLAELCGLLSKLSEEQTNFINQIEPMNIEARYPSYKRELLKSLSEEKCKEILTNTKELQKWVKTKL